jgi:hypothetical protein
MVPSPEPRKGAPGIVMIAIPTTTRIIPNAPRTLAFMLRRPVPCACSVIKKSFLVLHRFSSHISLRWIGPVIHLSSSLDRLQLRSWVMSIVWVSLHSSQARAQQNNIFVETQHRKRHVPHSYSMLSCIKTTTARLARFRRPRPSR